MSNNKKTLFFAIEDTLQLSKTLEKSLVVESAPINMIFEEQKDKLFNIVNVKIIPEDEAVLSLEIEELENFLDEQAQELTVAINKKYPKAISLTGEQVDKIVDKFEADREERLTVNLTEVEKIARKEMVAFVKKHNIKGVEASYVKNLFRDVSSLKLIEEDTPIGNQKKTLRSVFGDRIYLLDLSIHLIEETQAKIAAHINNKELNELEQVQEVFNYQYKATWPKIAAKEKTKLELAAEEVAQEQKNARGRPKKYKF